MKKILFVAAASAMLVACSATPEQCDPSIEMSLIQKMACSNSGSYDSRISQKQQTLTEAQARNQDLQAANSKARKAAASSAKQLAQKQAQLDQLSTSLDQTTAQLKQKAQGNSQILSEIQAIEKQMQQINGSGATDAAKEAQLKKLQSKLAAYKKALGM